MFFFMDAVDKTHVPMLKHLMTEPSLQPPMDMFPVSITEYPTVLSTKNIIEN